MAQTILDPQEDTLIRQRLQEQGNLPVHIAIIMDGDRRWAGQRNMSPSQGHRFGRESVRDVVRACGELGIEILTLYSFSTENWKRPKAEVQHLMRLLRESLRDEIDELASNNVRLNAIGRLQGLPKTVQLALKRALAATADNTGLLLNLALNYGGRSELVDGFRRLAAQVQAGSLDPGTIDEETIDQALYTAGLPDPDLLIRASGEMRLSNFLPWQTVYTEIWCTPVYWPDFRRQHLYEAIRAYQQRHRRFGGS
ncbi:MAG: isoprenyl transferase [Candidatus Latescibacteria bacterium]|nr:isoprenyl transferase [Candidatus Latescibacterota bacterium]